MINLRWISENEMRDGLQYFLLTPFLSHLCNRHCFKSTKVIKLFYILRLEISERYEQDFMRSSILLIW